MPKQHTQELPSIVMKIQIAVFMFPSLFMATRSAHETWKVAENESNLKVDELVKIHSTHESLWFRQA